MPIQHHPDLRRLTAEQILIIYSNSRQEFSPGLMHALKIAGGNPSINRIPDVVLNHYKLENTQALLIVGQKKRIVWCSASSLSLIIALAQLYEASHALNWEGCVELNPPDTVSTQPNSA